MLIGFYGIICILVGFWLGKGCPLYKPKSISDKPIEVSEEEIKLKEKQIEIEKQLQEMLNYSGVVKR